MIHNILYDQNYFFSLIIHSLSYWKVCHKNVYIVCVYLFVSHAYEGVCVCLCDANLVYKCIFVCMCVCLFLLILRILFFSCRLKFHDSTIHWSLWDRRKNFNRKLKVNSESKMSCADTTTKSVLYDFGSDFNTYKRIYKNKYEKRYTWRKIIMYKR